MTNIILKYVKIPFFVIATTVAIILSILTFIDAVKFIREPFFGFLYGPNLIVSSIHRDPWQINKIGIQPFDKIIEVNGIKYNRGDQLASTRNNASQGKVFNFIFERDGKLHRKNIKTKIFDFTDFLITYLVPFLIALIFIAIGSSVFIIRKDSEASFGLFCLCIFISIFYLTIFDSNFSFIFFRLHLVYLFFGAASVHLFSFFLDTKATERRNTIVVSTAYALAFILFVFKNVYIYDQNTSIILSKVSIVFMVLALTYSLGKLIYKFITTKDPIVLRKSRTLVFVVLIASLFGVIWAIHYLFGIRKFSPDLILLLSLTFPLIVSFAILKDDIFDIDRVFRISFSYGLLSVIAVIIFLAFVAFFAWLFVMIFEFESLPFAYIISTLLISLLFNPLRVKVQHFIHKIFYKESYDYIKTLTNFTNTIGRNPDLSSLLKLITGKLHKVMNLSSIAVLLKENNDEFALRETIDMNHPSSGVIKIDSKMILKKVFSSANEPRLCRRSLSRIDNDFFDTMKNLNTRLIVPLIFQNDLSGLIVLGKKKSGEKFNKDDLNILRTLSGQASVSIENAKLYIDKAKHERLAALGKVSSIMVHEIKNPLGIIKVSAGTIKKQATENPYTIELSDLIITEIDRMDRTISDILAFSRPRKADFVDININDFLDNIVYRAKIELENYNINIVHKKQKQEIFIKGDPEKFGNVFYNLFQNAKESIEKDGVIEITSKSETDKKSIQIEVTDNGAGIHQNKLDEIWNPFYSTKEKGTGLGLSISKQTIQEHDGDITVESEIGNGTSFFITLPLNARNK